MCATDNGLYLEAFIRNAFGVARIGDPAQLADASRLTPLEYLPYAKVAIGYSVAIHNAHIRNNCSGIGENDYGRMDSIIADIVAAPTHDEIAELIREYMNILARYTHNS
jgi:hypothetical protein